MYSRVSDIKKLRRKNITFNRRRSNAPMSQRSGFKSHFDLNFLGLLSLLQKQYSNGDFQPCLMLHCAVGSMTFMYLGKKFSGPAFKLRWDSTCPDRASIYNFNSRKVSQILLYRKFQELTVESGISLKRRNQHQLKWNVERGIGRG